MICQECGKKPASLHFTKIVNGEKTEFHFCDSCAREKGDLLPGTTNGFSIHNLLSGLLDFDMSNGANGFAAKAAPTIHCDHCGLTYTQFTKLGRLGCVDCYNNFAEKLDGVLRRVHGNTVHVGKVPKRSGGLIKHKREIEGLKKDMMTRIEREEFEHAAKIRDEIRAIEKKISEQEG
ncbi:UvrB/UvrC motif-containing protein [Paenibacillus sp. N1-5-1-14]|uniref:UvrB/UvrC motif-containing protein n=1 Tax=Paenibacillus radicibacter TaxID=2972488 RepID=UPI002158A399|nr:UvrB/UvrC motif-containing protein [Paenibacillus radicibacter]MCR8645830.1 UvrB/UvrC motif-containing protein [Paenibacillus radicibacter]